MAIVTNSEKHHINSIRQQLTVAPCRGVAIRIDGLHADYMAAARNAAGKQRALSKSVVAVGVIWRHTTFIAKIKGYIGQPKKGVHPPPSRVEPLRAAPPG